MTFDPHFAYSAEALEQFKAAMPLMLAQLKSLPRSPYRSNLAHAAHRWLRGEQANHMASSLHVPQHHVR